LEDKI
jgi:hypothetical protein